MIIQWTFFVRIYDEGLEIIYLLMYCGPDPKDQGRNQTAPVLHDGSDLFGCLRRDKLIVKGNTYMWVSVQD
jgi:hypothetical protein